MATTYEETSYIRVHAQGVSQPDSKVSSEAVSNGLHPDSEESFYTFSEILAFRELCNIYNLYDIYSLGKFQNKNKNLYVTICSQCGAFIYEAPHTHACYSFIFGCKECSSNHALENNYEWTLQSLEEDISTMTPEEINSRVHRESMLRRLRRDIGDLSADDIYNRIRSSLPEVSASTLTMDEVTNTSLIPSILTTNASADISSAFSKLKKWITSRENLGKSFIGSYIKYHPILEPYIDLLEDTLILLFQLLTADDSAHRYVAIVTFCKLRGNRLNTASALFAVFSSIVFDKLKSKKAQDEWWHKQKVDLQQKYGFETQDDEEDNPFRAARSMLNNWEKMKESMIMKKLHKFGLYILSVGLLDHTRINFQSFNYSKYEEACVRRTHRAGLTMIEVMLDTVLFVCERGYSYFQTGDISTIFHSGSSYEKWMLTAQRLIRESNFLNNPEPHGVNKFKFISELKEAIEKGQGIIKFTAKLEKTEKLMLQKMLNDLQFIECQELTRKEAQRPRKDPFAVLVHGSSSICKSQLKQMLFYHYAKCFGLPSTPEYMYTRCPADEFWSGFNSTQWCIVMDDIAFLRPNGEVDPTLLELLQVKNSVPYVPPQADLADKGRTPIRAELLIGTTNTQNLNLHAYFSCPFAVARRLSYIITAEIKPEFAKYKIMADSSKIPVTPSGEYMNIWNFTISIPVPAVDRNVDNQQTKYQVLHVFEEVNDMLAWYISAAKAHEESQRKALDADSTMSSVEVCTVCYRPIMGCRCMVQQADEEETESVASEMYFYEDDEDDGVVEDAPVPQMRDMALAKMWFFNSLIQHTKVDIPYETEAILYMYYYSNIVKCLFVYALCFDLRLIFLGIFLFLIYMLIKYFWIILAYFYQWKHGSLWKVKIASYLFYNETDAYRYIFRLAGNRVVTQARQHSPHLKLLAGVVTAAATSTVLVSMVKHFQTQSMSEGVKPTPHVVEKPAFYYHDPYVVTELDVSSQSKCAQQKDVYTSVKQCIAKFIFTWDETPSKRTVTTALNVHGNIWLFNKHCIKGQTGSIDVIRDPTSQNVSRNVRNLRVRAIDMHTDGHDLACVQLLAVAPGPSIMKYFPLDKPIGGIHQAMYFLIDKEGTHSQVPIDAFQAGRCPMYRVDAYHGRPHVVTKNGDCGSPAVVKVGTSYIIAGIHAVGQTGKHHSVTHHISQRTLEGMLRRYGTLVTKGTIKIDAPGYERTMVPLHTKAAVRFVEQGMVNPIGSFAGYRPQARSRVEKTYICDLVRPEYPLVYGPPNMGWQPWSLAIKDMTGVQFGFDESLIKQCAISFIIDIRTALDDQMHTIQVYDLETALNGADGVTYVDKINTNTSAGLPFRCSKKKFIQFDELGKIESIDKIILDRVEDIKQTYLRGERWHPIFCNHLKDDPTPEKKIAAFKTRVFSGGDFAWSIVVRQYFLSHVRMIQNNPYVFEAMPGIVAQSDQWSELYRYLTTFGSHRMVAGDYGKFDKKMAAPFILHAFDVLIAMSTQAGWSCEDIQVLRCIAYDTAFPLMDFHGDLIEVQGNPSGHPLTVIINCIVNSLYMRYAYAMTTKNSPRNFKRDVCLATYGDDNIMSVRSGVDAFNHTDISRVLASIGVEYTMADKESESLPFIDISKTSFLKRIFRWDDEMQAHMAVLEEASINKMLTSYVNTGILAPEAHSICAIETALREYFFYGRSRYENRYAYFKRIVREAKLDAWVRDSTFPSYNQLAIDFWKRHITEENQARALERIAYFEHCTSC